MNKELLEALNALEKEKNISKDSIFDAIEVSLISACKTQFSRPAAENIRIVTDREQGEFHCYVDKQVVASAKDVQDDFAQISLEDAQLEDTGAQVGDILPVQIPADVFGRIVTQNAKNTILQKIREEEKNVIFEQFKNYEKAMITGTVQRFMGRNISVNLDKTDGFLSENEQVKGEHFRQGERIKAYVVEVKKQERGPKIILSRTHPDLVRRLLESEVTEIKEGIVEIVSIAREPGSRSKVAVYSHNPNVDPVGACVGANGIRVSAVVDELRGEKIDIVNWDENPGKFIQNALSPAKIVTVFADPDARSAKVVVPDAENQLSLAIGKEGQNARLAAKLTGYKIDIKSETQAADAPGFRIEDYLDDMDYEDEYQDEYDQEYSDEYTEGYSEEYPEEYSGEYTEEYSEEYSGEYTEDYSGEYSGDLTEEETGDYDDAGADPQEDEE